MNQPWALLLTGYWQWKRILEYDEDYFDGPLIAR